MAAVFLVVLGIGVFVALQNPQPSGLVSQVLQKNQNLIAESNSELSNSSSANQQSDSDLASSRTQSLASPEDSNKKKLTSGFAGTGGGISGSGSSSGSPSITSGTLQLTQLPASEPPASSGFTASFSPTAEIVTLAEGESASFSVNASIADANFEWQLDGMQVSSEKNFEFKTASGFEGSYFLQAFAKNPVRTEFKAWNITVKKPASGVGAASSSISSADLNALKRMHSSLKQAILSKPSVPQTIIATVSKGSGEAFAEELKNLGAFDINVIPPGVLVVAKLAPEKFLQLAKNSKLKFLNPNFKYSAMETVNPNISQVNAPLIWAQKLNDQNITGKGVPIAILDTGVNSRNVYLGYRIGARVPYGSFDPEDSLGIGHGSHVAGIAAGGRQETKVDYNGYYWVDDSDSDSLVSGSVMVLDNFNFTAGRSFSGTWDLNSSLWRSGGFSLRCTLSSQDLCSMTYSSNIGTGYYASTFSSQFVNGKLNLWVYFSNPSSLQEIMVMIGRDAGNYRQYKRNSELPSSPGWFLVSFDVNSPSTTVGSLNVGDSLDYKVASTYYSANVTTQDFFDYLILYPSYCGALNQATGRIGCSQTHDINSLGIAPEASIHNFTVLDSSGNGNSDNIAWMVWVATAMYGEKILNLSLGAPVNDPNDPIVTQMVALHNDYNVNFIVSAGNCGNADPSENCGSYRGITTPGISDDAITVAAVDSSNQKAGFSSSGENVSGKPDLTAPGVNVVSTFKASPYYYTTDTLAIFSGTSMSAPHVSGAVALMLQANPNLSWQQVKNLLAWNAKDLGPNGFDVNYGWGLLDLNNILEPHLALSDRNISGQINVGWIFKKTIKARNAGVLGDLNSFAFAYGNGNLSASISKNTLAPAIEADLEIALNTSGGVVGIGDFNSWIDINSNKGSVRVFVNVSIFPNPSPSALLVKPKNSSDKLRNQSQVDFNVSNDNYFEDFTSAKLFYSATKGIKQNLLGDFNLAQGVLIDSFDDLNGAWVEAPSTISLELVDKKEGLAAVKASTEYAYNDIYYYRNLSKALDLSQFVSDGNFLIWANFASETGNLDWVFFALYTGVPDNYCSFYIPLQSEGWKSFEFKLNSCTPQPGFSFVNVTGFRVGWNNFSGQGNHSMLLDSALVYRGKSFYSMPNCQNLDSNINNYSCSIDLNTLSIPSGNHFLDLEVCDTYSCSTSSTDGNVFVNFLFTPGNNSLKIGINQTANFSALGIDVNEFGNGIEVNWFVDGVQNAYGLDFNVAAKDYSNGLHDVNAIVTDSKDAFQGQNFIVKNHWVLDINADKTPPVTTSDANSTWQNFNANVHLTCNDNNSGCALTQYRIDSDFSNTVSIGAWQNYSGTPISFSADGNFALDFNSTDNAGNSEATKRAFVLIDKNSPAVSAVNLSGAQTYNSFIKGNSVNWSASVSDGVSGINPATCETSSAGSWNSGNYSAGSCSNLTPISISNASTYQFSARVSDNASNQSQNQTISFTGDTILPLTTASGCSAGWNNSNQAISLSCNDSASGCALTRFRVDSGSWQNGILVSLTTDGNHKVDFNSSDNVGNAEVTKTMYCAVDKTPPTTISDINSTWQNFNASVHLTCNDGNGSGCALTQYRIDSDSSSVVSMGVWQNYSGTPILFSADGNFAMDFNSTDNAGNIEATKRAFVAIDRTAPVTTTSGCNVGWNLVDRMISLNCSDTSGSGCALTTFRVDNGVWQSGTSFSLTIDGNHQADFNSSDKLGYSEAVKTIYCAIDKNPPTGAILQFAETTTNSITANVSGATDSNGSGLAVLPYWFDIDSGARNSGWTASTSWLDPNLTPNTIHYYKVKVRDVAGRESAFTSIQFRYTLANNPLILDVNCATTTCSVSFDLNGNPGGTQSFIDENTGNFGGSDYTAWFTSGSPYIDSILSSGTQYCYQIKARNIDWIETPYSPLVCAFTVTSTPILNSVARIDKPLNSSQGAVDLSWNDVSGETSYTIYKSANGVNYSKVISGDCASTPQNDIACLDDGLNDNAAYYYKVQANSAGGDANSNIAAAFTPDRTSPETPAISVTAGASFADINWTLVSDNNTSQAGINYNIFRAIDAVNFSLKDSQTGVANYHDSTAIDSNAPQTPNGLIVSNSTDNSLDLGWNSVSDNGSKYYYKVQAIDSSGNDSNSSSDSGIVISGIKQYWLLDLNQSSKVYGPFFAINATVSGLSLGSQHCFRVKAQDVADNNSALSTAIACGTTGSGSISLSSSTHPSETSWYKTASASMQATGSFNHINYLLDQNPTATALAIISSGIPDSDGIFSANLPISGVWFVHAIALNDLNQGSITDDFKIQFDNIAPATSASGCPAGWNNSNQAITLSCNDSASGCALTQYRIDSGSWQNGNSISLTTDGNHSVDFNSSDNAGNSESVKTVSCMIDKAVPSTPSLTSGVAANSSISVSASDSSDSLSGLNALPYWIEESITSSNSGWIASGTWLKNGLLPNTQYSFKAKARDIAGNESEYSPILQRFTLANIPLISSVGCGINSCTVAFDLNSNPSGTEYFIEETTGNSGASNSGWLTTALPFVDSGLASGLQYCYRIKARNSESAETLFSTGSCGITEVANLTLTAAVNAGVPLNSSQGIVDLGWNDVSGETGYEVFRSIDSANYNSIIALPANSTAYSDTGLNDASIYYYKVQANFAGSDVFSNIASARTPDRTSPSQPAIEAVSPGVQYNGRPAKNFVQVLLQLVSDNYSQNIVYNVFKRIDSGSTFFLADSQTAIPNYSPLRNFDDSSAVDYAAPEIPTGLAVTSPSGTSLAVSWNRIEDNASEYSYFAEVVDEAGNDSNSSMDSATALSGVKQYWLVIPAEGDRAHGPFAQTNSASISATITGLSEGIEYCFKVKAQDNADNNSLLSEAICGTTQDGFNLNKVPFVSLVSCSVGSCTVVFDLNGNPSGSEYFIDETTDRNGATDSGWLAGGIAYYDNSGLPIVQLPNLYFDRGLIQKTIYCYRIKARNPSSHAETAYSSQKCQTTRAYTSG